MRGKESRRVRTYNHLISRRIVQQAERTNSTLVLEDLQGLRAGATVRQSQRRERFSWAYAQLQTFIVYKAKLAGLPVLFVPPAYTSKTCSRCHFMADHNRVTQALFRCGQCGFCWKADDNAALNIRFLGAESTCHKRQIYMQDYLQTDRRKPLAQARA
jgi:putative transposase